MEPAGKIIKCDFLILGDDGRNALRHEKYSTAVIPLTQKGDCFAPEAAHFPIGQNRFQAVTDLSPILVFIRSDQNENATRLLLWPHAPLCRQLKRILLNGLPFERSNGDHRNLRLCLLIDFGAQRRQFFLGLRAQHAREIVDITLRL